MKRLLVSIPMGMSVRNIIQTDVFPALMKNFNLVIMSHLTPQQIGISDNDSNSLPDHIIWLKYPALNVIQKLLMREYRKIDYFYFWLKIKPATVKKYIDKLKQESLGQYVLQYVLAEVWNLVMKSGLGKKIISCLYRSKTYKNILEEYKIDAVFVPSFDVREDMILMNVAKNLDIPVICFVHSWDNLPSRGSLLVEPDILLVWNNIMMQQAQSLHNIPKEKIRVVGIPQYDTYRYKTPLSSRKEFMQNKNIEKYEKVITYTCSAERVFSDEDVFLSHLIKLTQQKAFGNAVLIIRLHPTERIEQYMKQFQGLKAVIIDVPDSLFAATYTHTSHISQSGIENFVNIMKHSDVVINLASTVTIDAAVFDTPVVNIAYNINLPSNAWNSAEKWYDSTHYGNIVKTGGVRIAHSEEELIRYVQDYLQDPSRDKEGRQRLVKEQCYKIDGKASDRIISVIQEVVD